MFLKVSHDQPQKKYLTTIFPIKTNICVPQSTKSPGCIYVIYHK